MDIINTASVNFFIWGYDLNLNEDWFEVTEIHQRYWEVQQDIREIREDQAINVYDLLLRKKQSLLSPQ